MGSSSGGNFSTPETWKPPANMINPAGGQAVNPPQAMPSFLPNQAGQVATGLTPQMMAAISAPPPRQQQPTIQPVDQSTGGGNSQGRALLAMLMGGGR